MKCKPVVSLLLLFSQLLGAQSTFYQSIDYDGDITWGMQVIPQEGGFSIIGLQNCDGKGCVSWLEVDANGIPFDRFYVSDTTLSITGTNRGSYLRLGGQHFVTTTLTNSDGVIKHQVSRFDPHAQLVAWTRTYGGEIEDIPTRLVTDSLGFIYSYYSKRLSVSPFISTTNLLKIDTLGDVQWEAVIGIPDDYNNAFNHLYLPNGEHLTFYAACEPDVFCQSFLTGYGLYVTKVDDEGQVLWSQELRRGDFTRWNGTDPVLLDNGLVALNWINDTFPLASGEVRFQDMLLWMDQEGELVQEYFFPRDRERNIRSMTKAANGDIIGAGSVDLNGLDLGQGGYVFRMSPAGELLWERYLADVRFPLDNHYFSDVIEAEDGGIVLTGLFRDSIPGSDNTLSNVNVWLVKLDSMGCLEPGCSRFQVMGATVDTQAPVVAEEELRLFPNPTATFAQLQWPDPAAVDYPLQVAAVDLMGRRVYERTFSAAPAVVQCGAWPPGYYALHVRDANGRQWVRRLVVR